MLNSCYFGQWIHLTEIRLSEIRLPPILMLDHHFSLFGANVIFRYTNISYNMPFHPSYPNKIIKAQHGVFPKMGVPLNHPKSSVLMGCSMINQEYLWKPPHVLLGIAFCCQMCPSSLRCPAVFGERLMARIAHRTTSVVATHCLEKCRDAEKFTGYPKLAILMRKVMMDHENLLCSFVFFFKPICSMYMYT